MGKILAILSAAKALMPAAKEAVLAVENTLPEGTKGEQKLEAVRQMMEKAIEAENTLEVQFASVWPVLNAFITALVASLNVLGIFKKKS